jgi:dihydroneopterin aldolase
MTTKCKTALSGKVGIEDFKVMCIIGELPEEREWEQEISISLSYEQSMDRVAETDSLQDTIDYVAVAEKCRTVAIEGKFNMLEALICHMADALLEQFKMPELTIKVRKPGALEFASATTVEITRYREAGV